MAGTSLLSPSALDSVLVALRNVFTTFAKEPITLLLTSVSFPSANFGEVAKPTEVPKDLMAIYAFTTAHDGKYDIVQRTDKGAEEHDGFRLFIWKEDMVAQGVDYINAETDQVIFKGKKYRIDFAAPSAQFSDLGDLLWEVEIRFRHREP